MSRDRPRGSSGGVGATDPSYSAVLTRLPSGVSSCTSSGSVPGGFFAVVRLPAVLLVLALRRDVRAAVLSTVTCAPPSVRLPGFAGRQCGSPVAPGAHRVGARVGEQA